MNLREVQSLLRVAQKPLLLLGHGIRLAGAQPMVDPLLERLGIPALTSWGGLDLTDHPFVYGHAGIYGNKAANRILMAADFILAIGTRLAIPQLGYDPSLIPAKGVVVDIDHREAHKHEPHLEGLVMDAGEFMGAILTAFEFRENRLDWIEECLRAAIDEVTERRLSHPEYIDPADFLDQLHPHLKPDEVIVTDSGTALLCAHQRLKLKPPQRLITTTGLGEMGFGLPAAVGASFARGKGPVLCLNTDGGMMLNLQEMQTIVHHQLPVKIIVFENDGYGMIKNTQKTLGHVRTGVDRKSGLSCPNFVHIARAFGMDADICRTWGDFDAIIPHLWDSKWPFLLQVPIDPEFAASPKVATIRREDGTLYSPPLYEEAQPA